MNITADTNLLVRIVIQDDERQAATALGIFEGATSVAITLPCICEFAWVLGKVYRLPREKIAAAIRAVAGRANAAIDEAAVAAGLITLDAGGDFADGVIAAAGRATGAEVFVSFDRKAVRHVRAAGLRAEMADGLA